MPDENAICESRRLEAGARLCRAGGKTEKFAVIRGSFFRRPHIRYNPGKEHPHQPGSATEIKHKTAGRQKRAYLKVRATTSGQYTRSEYLIHYRSIQRTDLVTKLHNIIKPEKR